jgi:hypothetical protein
MPPDAAAMPTRTRTDADAYRPDRRRKDARDAAKVAAEIMAALGADPADLTTTDMTDIDTLAVNTIELNRLNAQRLRGEVVDPDLHGTAQNSYRRSRDAVRALERRLRRQRGRTK